LADLKETGGHITNEEIPHQPAFDAGNNEFRELFKQFTLEIQAMQEDGKSISAEEQQRIVKEIIKWKRVQEEFYLGQQFDLHQILKNNPAIKDSPQVEKIRMALLERFSDFETITQGLRQEYLSLVRELGFVDEENQPLLDQISRLEQEIGELNNEISLRPPNIDKLAVNKQSMTNQLETLKRQFDQKLESLTQSDFHTSIQSVGY
jgi:predicted  nucleic acid-binding Zn-ribbon protein